MSYTERVILINLINEQKEEEQKSLQSSVNELKGKRR